MLVKRVGICLTLIRLISLIMNNKGIIRITLTIVKYAITLILGALGGAEMANDSVSNLLNF